MHFGKEDKTEGLTKRRRVDRERETGDEREWKERRSACVGADLRYVVIDLATSSWNLGMALVDYELFENRDLIRRCDCTYRNFLHACLMVILGISASEVAVLEN